MHLKFRLTRKACLLNNRHSRECFVELLLKCKQYLSRGSLARFCFLQFELELDLLFFQFADLIPRRFDGCSVNFDSFTRGLFNRTLGVLLLLQFLLEFLILPFESSVGGIDFSASFGRRRQLPSEVLDLVLQIIVFSLSFAGEDNVDLFLEIRKLFCSLVVHIR